MRLSNESQKELEWLKTNDPNQYQDTLARLIDEAGIYETPGQALTASEEVFEDAVTGERVPPEQLVKSLAQVQIQPGRNGLIIVGYNNAATPMQLGRGEYKGDISINKTPQSAGVPALRVKDVKTWAGDKLAGAYLDPNSVTEDDPINLQRAAAMGRAASTGDGPAMIASNKRYEWNEDEINQFLKLAKIREDGFGSSIRKSGLDKDRVEVVIDPRTSKRVLDLRPEEQKQFFEQRIFDLTKIWLEGGGRGFNDLRGEIGVPGNEYQMEHNYPFSKSNMQGFAESPDNRVGFLRRYINSEKADQSPKEYYQQQRLAYLANKQGIDITGVAKSVDGQELNGVEALKYMLERDNPSVIKGDRRKKDAQDILLPKRKKQNIRLAGQALAAFVN